MISNHSKCNTIGFWPFIQKKFILFIQPSLCIFLETPPSIISSPSNQNQTNKYVCDEFYDFQYQFLGVDTARNRQKSTWFPAHCGFFYLSERKRGNPPLLHKQVPFSCVCVYMQRQSHINKAHTPPMWCFHSYCFFSW